MMEAALLGSDEAVSSLLSWGASPDKTAINGHTALIFAIQSKCSTMINLLAPVTKMDLGGALPGIAISQIEISAK